MKPHAYYPMDTYWEKGKSIVFVASSPAEGLEARLSKLIYEKESYLSSLPDRVRECDADKRSLFIRQQLALYGDQLAQLMLSREVLPKQERYQEIDQFYQEEIALFESILLHIQKEYARFIDKDLPMPAGQLLKAKMRLGARTAELRRRLAVHVEDLKLLNIALEPYEHIHEEPERQLTYVQYEYAQQYLDELETINPDDDIDCKLRTALVYMNLNTRAFLHYCYKTVNQEVRALVTTAEKLDKLEEMNKIFTQLSTKPGCYYTKGEPNTVELLLRIVKGEKKHIRKQKKIYREHSPIAKDEMPAGKVKLETAFTVEQWAALLKLWYQKKVITNKVQMDFLRLWAAIIQTPKKDVISVDSLRSKFGSISPETKNWLADTLLSWSRSIHRDDLL